VCFSGELLKAQPVVGNEILVKGFIETGGFVVNEAMPFWFRANQSGIVPLSGSTGQLRLGLYRDNHRVNREDSLMRPKNIDWGYGLEVVGNAGQQNQLILPEGYLSVRWKQFEIYAGRRRGMVGLVDTLLTSGSYAWSGNALPVPKIQIGTIGYVPIGFTKGFVAINALFNHGWFSSGFVRNSYLHQKALYVRLGKPTAKVNLYFGGNHEVQWGGFAPSLVGVPSLSDDMDGRFASDLDAFYRVVTSTFGTGYFPPQGVISIDQGNRIGNHLGSFDGGIELKMKGYKMFAYRQNLYETGSLFYLTNITDGLHGIRIQRSQPSRRQLSVDRLLLEFFDSRSQGGPEFVIGDAKRHGRNNYFNHSQYQEGWTYQGRTIGTPFLTTRYEANPSLPQGYPITNNRVTLWHMGLSGQIAQRVNWLTKLSYSQNYGTYDVPYPAGTNQFSMLLMLNAPVQIPIIKACQLTSSFGLDTGNLLPNSYGCYIGVRKSLFEDASYRTGKKY
jgi:hypothetical protein